MNWYFRDTDTKKYFPLTEVRTQKACQQIVGIAIGRWLLSGLDVPDSEATDGVSEVEAAMEF